MNYLQARIAHDLKELRDSSVFGFIMINALFVLIVFLLQLNKDNIHVKWPLGVKTNITYDEATQEVTHRRHSNAPGHDCLQTSRIQLVFSSSRQSYPPRMSPVPADINLYFSFFSFPFIINKPDPDCGIAICTKPYTITPFRPKNRSKLCKHDSYCTIHTKQTANAFAKQNPLITGSTNLSSTIKNHPQNHTTTTGTNCFGPDRVA